MNTRFIAWIKKISFIVFIFNFQILSSFADETSGTSVRSTTNASNAGNILGGGGGNTGTSVPGTAPPTNTAVTEPQGFIPGSGPGD